MAQHQPRLDRAVPGVALQAERGVHRTARVVDDVPVAPEGHGAGADAAGGDGETGVPALPHRPHVVKAASRDEQTWRWVAHPAGLERFELLEDTLEIVTRLFSGEVVSYEGKRISLRAAQILPRPVQHPHPPIWIGGTGPRRTLPLAARYADVWHAFGTPTSLRDAGAELDRLAVEAGRDPSAIMRAGSLSLDDLETARRHAAK